MITKEQAIGGWLFHENGCSMQVGPRGGRTVHQRIWRRNGATKIWKHNPDRWSVPIKLGMYEFGYLTESNAGLFHAPDDCPVQL